MGLLASQDPRFGRLFGKGSATTCRKAFLIRPTFCSPIIFPDILSRHSRQLGYLVNECDD